MDTDVVAAESAVLFGVHSGGQVEDNLYIVPLGVIRQGRRILSRFTHVAYEREH